MNSKTVEVFAPSLKFPMLVLLAGLLTAALAADNPEPARRADDGKGARDELQKILDGINQLREENARLKEENAQLRRENQQLRRLLAEKVEGGALSTPVANTVSGVQTRPAGAETERQLTHWFTTSSGERHNSRCRHFKTTEGRLCGPDEGKRCELCGG